MYSILLKIINPFIGYRDGSSFPCGFLLSERKQRFIEATKNISLVSSLIIWSKFHRGVGVRQWASCLLKWGELSIKVGRVVF